MSRVMNTASAAAVLFDQAVTSAPFQESFSSWPTQSTTCTTPIPPLSGYYIYNFI